MEHTFFTWFGVKLKVGFGSLAPWPPKTKGEEVAFVAVGTALEPPAPPKANPPELLDEPLAALDDGVPNANPGGAIATGVPNLPLVLVVGLKANVDVPALVLVVAALRTDGNPATVVLTGGATKEPN